MINLNINFTVVFDGKQTSEQRNIALNELEQALERFKPHCAMSTLATVRNVSQANQDANKTYLASKGYARTPKVSDVELKVREQFADREVEYNEQSIDGNSIDWSDVKVRHQLLLAKGYDIFNVNRDKDVTSPNSPVAPMDSGAELVAGISFDDIPTDD